MQELLRYLLLEQNQIFQIVIIAVFSFLGFAWLPSHWGRSLWWMLFWFVAVNIVVLLEWHRIRLGHWPFGFALLSQLPWMSYLVELLSRSRREAVQAVPLRELVLAHGFRIMAMVLFLALVAHQIPQDFAVRVAVGEVFIGIFALLLYLGYREEFWYEVLVAMWNLFGLGSALFFSGKVLLAHPDVPHYGFSPEIFRLFSSFPYVWMILFWVPLAICLHLAIFVKVLPSIWKGISHG